MTWHHDHIGNKAHHPRMFVKCGGDIRREADGTGKMPAFNFAHPGWWGYWMLPEAFLNYEDFTAKHVAGSTAGEKGAVTLKLQFAPDASVSEAFGLRVLEHVATIGVEQLAKEEPAAPRRTPLQIHNLVARWRFKGQDTEETEEERTARFAAFAAKREAQAKAKAEKAAARLTASQALAAAAREGLTLVPADTDTGFMYVHRHANQYKVKICEGDKMHYLGLFATPQQAALEVARRLGKEGSAAAAAARVHLTPEQAETAAAEEGLVLVPASSVTGYKGVYVNNGRYIARIREKGKKVHLGNFATAAAAALHYAQHLGPERAAEAAAEAAEAAAAASGKSRKRPAENTVGIAGSAVGAGAAVGSSTDASALKRKRRPPSWLAGHENGDEGGGDD